MINDAISVEKNSMRLTWFSVNKTGMQLVVRFLIEKTGMWLWVWFKSVRLTKG